MASPPAQIGERLRAIAAHAAHQLASATVQEMQARYDFGHALHVVRYGSSAPGANALDQLAHSLGTDPSALRRIARVSEMIGPSEFEWLTTLRTSKGDPLSWSHLEILSTVRVRSRRKMLVEAIVAESLSVRALSSRIREGARRE